MDSYQNVADYFQTTIEVIANSVDTLAEPLQRASALMVKSLVNDRKIVVCGTGVDAALAQLFSASLLNRFERERPALPALCLSADAASISGIADSFGLDEIFARQLRALGQEGDVLLCISSTGDQGSIDRAITVAHERNMAAVVLSNTGDSGRTDNLQPADVALRCHTSTASRAVELHSMTLHCLCKLIDQGLFGEA